MEPLEGQEEEDRVAGVSRLLLRTLRSRRYPSILKCIGAVNTVYFDGRPGAIQDYEVESLRLLITSELQYDPCLSTLT
jgi:hypothetical protein